MTQSLQQVPFLSNKDVAPNLSARWCFCPQTYGGSMNLLDLFMPRWSLSSNLVAVPLNSCSWFLGCLGKTNKRKQKEAGRRWIFNEFFCMEFSVKLEGDSWSVAYQQHIWKISLCSVFAVHKIRLNTVWINRPNYPSTPKSCRVAKVPFLSSVTTVGMVGFAILCFMLVVTAGPVDSRGGVEIKDICC